jgi:hypothetical protein
MYPFNKYSLKTYYEQNTVLGPRNYAVVRGKKTNKLESKGSGSIYSRDTGDR